MTRTIYFGALAVAFAAVGGSQLIGGDPLTGWIMLLAALIQAVATGMRIGQAQ